MRIDMLEVYEGRLQKVETEIIRMSIKKNFKNYGILKKEKLELKDKIEKLKEKRNANKNVVLGGKQDCQLVKLIKKNIFLESRLKEYVH